jgi:hypothetical protein
MVLVRSSEELYLNFGLWMESEWREVTTLPRVTQLEMTVPQAK